MENQNIGRTLTDVARLYPQRRALMKQRRGGDYQCFRFRELARITDGYARILTERGVRPGDRVMLMVRPSLEFICLSFALFRLGAVVVLIDPGMGYANLRRCVGEVGPDVFIGIPAAQLFRRLFPAPFASVRISICVGFSGGLLGANLDGAAARLAAGEEETAACHRRSDELAAILFTTGSTGPPKGVRYTHGNFQAQLELIRDYYRIAPGDVDQPAFPLFALFSIALGAAVVIPEMNPARPAQVVPARFIRTIREQQVTYSFGSPAIWNVVADYCRGRGVTLPSLRKVLMAGAPVPGELLRRMREILPDDAEIHTPYGATESLPVTSISDREVLAETWPLTCRGGGTCVGRPLPGIEVRIVEASEGVMDGSGPLPPLPVNQIGEIMVSGPVVTTAYDGNEPENRLAKVRHDGKLWHRMGDMGYLDAEGRLWFCGRKAHRVVTVAGILYSVCCEAIFNEHPKVRRSALVGIGDPGGQRPVMVVEPAVGVRDREKLFAELRGLGAEHPMTAAIEIFLVHPAFPVDIRHNAKIFREKLADWAERELRSGK